MKYFGVIVFSMLLIPKIAHADIEVSTIQKVCDGPYVNTGDISRINIAVEKALSALEHECSRQNPDKFSMLKGLEKITKFETTYGTFHCLEIEVVDQCFVR